MMMEEQEKRIDFDLQKIKNELYNEDIIINDDPIQIHNGYILKQCHVNGKEKLFINQYCGIIVELSKGEQLNHYNKIIEDSKMIEEFPEIFNEHTLQVKQQWRTAQYIYKKSTQLLFDIDQWKIYTIQNQDGMYHIFRLFSKIFYIINDLWQNHQQYQINLDLNNFAIDSENNIIIFNQSNVQYGYEINYINQFGNFMLEILKDINKYRNEQTPQEIIILNQCCELLQLIFQNKIQNLNQIRIIFYEIITKLFFSNIDNDKIYAESYEIYKDQFEIFKNKNKEIALVKYYKNRNLEFDYKQVNAIETECINNIKQNKDTLKNYLVLIQINTLFKRNYSQSVEYLNKAIELDPYDIDILIGFMMIIFQKRSYKLEQPLRFIFIYLSDLFEDYWQIYYLISCLYVRDSLVKESQEYMAKTLQFNNTDPQIISLDAIIKLSLMQNQRCEELIESAIQQNKINYPNVYFRKGYILDTLNIDGCLEWYEKCLEIDPLYSDAYYQIGYYYFQKQNIKKSIEFFNKCIAIDPYDSTAYSNQEYNYRLLNDKIKQKYYLEKSIEKDPNNYQGYYSLGLFYRRQGNYEEAIKMWKKSIEINSKYPEPYFFIAYQLQERQEIASSIQYFKKYYQLSNNKEKTFLQLSFVQRSNRDFELSEHYGLELMKNDHTNQQIYYLLNQLYEYHEQNGI